MTGARRLRRRVDQEIVAVAEEVFDAVETVRRATIDLHRAAESRGVRLLGADISKLRGDIQEVLRQKAGLVVGLGLIVAPDLLGDQALRLEWWQDESGSDEFAPLNVDLNRHSPGFYDYETAEWFDMPRRSGDRQIVGPYVDVHGTGRYLLTFTQPVESSGRFLGVAGADVPVAWLERRLLQTLGTERELLLVNPDGRIVFSTSPRWLTGDLLPAEQDSHLLYRDLPSLPWRLSEISPNR